MRYSSDLIRGKIYLGNKLCRIVGAQVEEDQVKESGFHVVGNRESYCFEDE